MLIVYLLLLLIAAICFGIAAFAPPRPRPNLVALGLLAWVGVPLLHALVSLAA